MDFDQDQMVRVVSLYFFTYFTLQAVGFLSSMGVNLNTTGDKKKTEKLNFGTFILLGFYIVSMAALAFLVLISTGEGGSKIINTTLGLCLIATIPATVGGQNIYESPITMYTIPAAITAFTIYATG